MTTARAPTDGGFTLVEALVSIFVFSLIAAGCMLMLTQSVMSQKRVGQVHEQLRELQTARALLSADMAQLVVRGVRQEDGERAPSFLGGGDQVALAFVRMAGDPDPGSAISTTLVYVEYAVENGKLIRRTRSYLDAAVRTPTSERVVFGDAKDVRFQFWDGVNWAPQWIGVGSGSLPRAVALDVRLPRYGAVRIESATGHSM